jgi:HEAT repeat protein
LSSLTGLWLVSLALSAAALAVMSGLIAGRWIGSRRAVNREAERRRLIPLLLGVERGAEAHAAPDIAPALLTDLSVELIQLVRGGDKENFVASATRLGVPLALRARLRSRSPRIRFAAAEALAHFADDESAAALERALDDRNADVRLSAAMALAEMGRAPPAATLVDKLSLGRQENSMLVVGLFEQLAAARPEEIRGLIEDPSSPGSVKAAAIEALSASGDYSLVPLITALALRADPMSVELPRYLRSLGEFAHPAGAPAVEAALSSPAWWVRAAAAEAAGRIGMANSAERLALLLDDTDWWVRFRAGEALAALGDAGRRLLGETARGGPALARRAAALTLAERGLKA